MTAGEAERHQRNRDAYKRQSPEAAQITFVGWLSGYLDVGNPTWQPDASSYDGERLCRIRSELRALLEAHAPRLLGPPLDQEADFPRLLDPALDDGVGK